MLILSPNHSPSPTLSPSFPEKSKTPDVLTSGVHTNKLGGDLLSHGNIPHYHRHNSVSLLSSVWNQVGPPHYRRQKSVDDILLFLSYLFLFISLSSSNQNKLTLNSLFFVSSLNCYPYTPRSLRIPQNT